MFSKKIQTGEIKLEEAKSSRIHLNQTEMKNQEEDLNQKSNTLH